MWKSTEIPSIEFLSPMINTILNFTYSLPEFKQFESITKAGQLITVNSEMFANSMPRELRFSLIKNLYRP